MTFDLIMIRFAHTSCINNTNKFYFEINVLSNFCFYCKDQNDSFLLKNSIHIMKQYLTLF